MEICGSPHHLIKFTRQGTEVNVPPSSIKAGASCFNGNGTTIAAYTACDIETRKRHLYLFAGLDVFFACRIPFEVQNLKVLTIFL